MKRRAKSNVGMFPNMQEYTLKKIAASLVSARKKHPKVGDHLKLLESYVAEMRDAFERHHHGKGPAYQVQVVGYEAAAMLIRCIEEGTKGARYRGSVLPLGHEDSQYQPVGD